MAQSTSFFSRFTMKFIEVIGAGIATAVSGYLLAHLSGYWSAPAHSPAALELPASISTVIKSSRVKPAVPAKASESADADAQSAPVKGTTPETSAAKDAKNAIAPDVTPARATAIVTPAVSAPAEKEASAPHAAISSRKPATSDAHAIESKARDADTTARDAKTVEEQVRAALAKLDASRPRPPEAAPPAVEISPPAAAVQPRPAEAAVGSVAVAPPAEIAPQPAPQAPLVPAPLGTVEIKSQPVADVAAAPPPAPDSQDDAKSNDKGFLSTIRHIPDMLRPSSGATSDPPRPPLPVGD